ncbi:MAG: ATP-binding cassette domain-containing protein [Bacteroidales bacterium]|nr:ATP-binding cassette domain-containing protein [Bacteroidales bacterium]
MGKKVGKTGTFQFLSKHLKGFDTLICVLLAMSVLMLIPKLATPIINQILIDNVLSGVNPEWGTPLIIFAAVFTVFEILVRLVGGMMWRQRLCMSISSTTEMFWHAIRLPVGYYHDKYAGDIAGRVFYGRDLSMSIDRMIYLAGDIMLVIVYLFFMIKYSAVLSIFAIFHIFLNIVVVRMVHKSQISANREMQREKDKLQGFTASGIENIEAIKGGTAEARFFNKWLKQMAMMQNSAIECNAKNLRTKSVPLFLSSVSNVLVLGIGAWYIMQGRLSVGMLMTFQSFMTACLAPMNNLTECGQIFASVKANKERMEEVLEEECDVPERLESIDDADTGKLRGEVEMKDVTFGYDRSLPPIISHFNLHLEPGKSVAFVGPSGCGKSTLSKLISGLYKPWSGEILFDGKKQEDINRDVFANSIAVVDQNIVLFDGTISDNVKLWDDSIEDFVMVMACHDAQIHEEIAVRNDNYQAKLESGGKNFSGGQRQRLELATAFAKEPSVMIMDEGTSALDAVTEDCVMKNIRNMGCSQIIIAHRLSTIRDCDEIIVLKDGKVEERGTHRQLMANKGYYSKLVEN